ncbi:uncharacterized protein N7459_008931 [Penicillium hispanicum]|uniref:uncharacterized protein n=1 Tax=Penicillium hispanicum TaxID=1080232 RepID=UPI002540D420|nr:uncharacterized protein N7459_008931 [Penicillium hispanicum]KAJ5569501.1 hypothetical protein N7459_008931 [Penicillium hispanicum]
MRVGKGCERCRHRHIRCVIPAGASSCTPCSRLGRVCHLDPRFQFKAVHHVYQKSHGASSRYDLVWDEGQVWVDVSQPVAFVSEAEDSKSDGLSQKSSLHTPNVALMLEDASDMQCETLPKRPPGEGLYGHLTPHGSVCSQIMPTLDDGPTLSLREASLMRCFIQEIAPWADICDPQSHFGTAVPQRALRVPMVLNAIFAFTARHEAILCNCDDWEASSYHGKCLELLITALDQPEHTYDENLLITVVILRMYEELEHNTDQKFHLLGSNRLVNLLSRSASSRGLAEATSWQFLRQAIYSSIVQHQPLQLDLRNYERSYTFQREDDAALANMIIFHCAHIVQLCHDVPRQLVEEDVWRQVSDSVEQWHQNKPITWQPLRYQASSVSADRPFPEIWMMSGPAVVGMQYYHTAWIFLTLSDPDAGLMNDYEMARSRRLVERTIATHVITVIGLSLSNESVQNAYFMACHLLHRFGYCLRHPVEQQGSLRFLCRVEKVLGWRTAWIRRELEGQWAELAALDTQIG